MPPTSSSTAIAPMAISGVFEFPDLVPEELGTAANCCGWDWCCWAFCGPGCCP